MVTEMLTSDVLMTSIGVRQRSNTSNTRRRNPCAISMRVEVMSTTVMWRLHASAASGSSTGGLAVISVPPPSNRRLFRILTGMFLETAGRIVLGCSTFAPKYASSEASSNDSRGTTCADGDDARVGRHHAVDVGPDLNLAGVERRRRVCAAE